MVPISDVMAYLNKTYLNKKVKALRTISESKRTATEPGRVVLESQIGTVIDVGLVNNDVGYRYCKVQFEDGYVEDVPNTFVEVCV